MYQIKKIMRESEFLLYPLSVIVGTKLDARNIQPLSDIKKRFHKTKLRRFYLQYAFPKYSFRMRKLKRILMAILSILSKARIHARFTVLPVEYHIVKLVRNAKKTFSR